MSKQDAAGVLSAGDAERLARVLKAVADPVRLRLLSLIDAHAGGEACVCDMSGAFDLTGPTISHHLKVLRQAGLITGERRATWVYYRTVPEVLHRLSEALRPGCVGAVPDWSRSSHREALRPQWTASRTEA